MSGWTLSQIDQASAAINEKLAKIEDLVGEMMEETCTRDGTHTPERIRVLDDTYCRLKTEAGKIYMRAREMLEDSQLQDFIARLSYPSLAPRPLDEEDIESLYLYGSGQMDIWLSIIHTGQNELTLDQKRFLATHLERTRE